MQSKPNVPPAAPAQNEGLCWRSMEALIEVGALRQYLDQVRAHDAATARLVEGLTEPEPKAQPSVRVNLALPAKRRARASEVRAVGKAQPACDLHAMLLKLGAA